MWRKIHCGYCSSTRRIGSGAHERGCPVCSPDGCEGCHGAKTQKQYIRGVLTTITCQRCGGSGQQPHISFEPFWLEPRKAIDNPRISTGEPVPSWMTPAPDGWPKK